MHLPNLTTAGLSPWRDWLGALAEVHSDGDYIFHERFLEASRPSQFEYRKRDFLYKGGEWRGVSQSRVVRDRHESRVLALGHSDYSFSGFDALRTLSRPGFKSIFAVNLTIPFRKWLRIQPLPLGLSNPTNESQLHGIYGDINQLKAAWSKSFGQIASYRLYLNLNLKTNLAKRGKLFALARAAAGGAVIGTYSPTFEGRSQYLDEVASMGLVICPEGNGLDTHRFWETLYLGGIPVVEQNSYGARLSSYLGLPSIVIDSWNCLGSPSKVQVELENVLSAKWNSKALRFSEWRDALIKGTIGDLAPARSHRLQKRKSANRPIGLTI